MRMCQLYLLRWFVSTSIVNDLGMNILFKKLLGRFNYFVSFLDSKNL